MKKCAATIAGGHRSSKISPSSRERPVRRRATAWLAALCGLAAAAATVGGPAAAALAGIQAAAATPAAASPAAAPAASAASAASATPVAIPAGAPARLSRAEVPATGRQEAIVSIAAFGRYSVRAASAQGTEVRVVDRMAGEIGAAGEAGSENGRLDLFLDRGDYKLVVESHEHGEGTAKLSVEPFADRQGGAAPLALVERKLLAASLEDLRQVSYWIPLAARREVRLEAAGRNLADLRLWRDGSWLEDVTPSCAPIQPVTGKPLLRCEIATVLPAGLYLVAAYGGAGQAWAEEGAEHPFYLRWGYPSLPDAGRRRYVVSPFGEDWFAVPANVNYARVELPQAQPMRLAAGWAAAGDLLSGIAAKGDTAEVLKNSSPPVADLHVSTKPDASAASTADTANTAAGERGALPSVAEPEAADTAGKGGEAGDQEGDGEAAPEQPGTGANGANGANDSNAANGDADSAGAPMQGDAAAQEDAAGAGANTPAASGQESANVGTGEPADQPMAPDAANASDAANAPNAPDTAADQEGDAAPRGERGATPAEGEAAAAEPEAAEGADAGAATEGQSGGAAAAPGGPQLWLAVRGTPGQAYVLQHFEQRSVYNIDLSGRYWISTIHSGDPADSVDAAAVLTSGRGSGAQRLEATYAPQIDGTHAWARRFNMQNGLTLYLDVKEKGRYEVVATPGGRYRIEPFLTTRPPNYKAPAFGGSGSHWDLDPGIYVLSAEPRGGKAGIFTIGVRPAGKFPRLLAEAAAGGAAFAVRGAVRFAPQTLDPNTSYRLYTNLQPGVETGVVLRPWPVDLGQPLPVSQRPGEPLAIDFTVAGPGTLRAETEDGRLLAVSVDGGPWTTAAPVAAGGGHHLQVQHPAPAATGASPAGNSGDPGDDRTVSYSLTVEPAALAAAAPLPPLPAGAIAAALPNFPQLQPGGAPRFLDLTRGAGATFRIDSETPGLYELRTTGMLATAAALRTRTVTELATGSRNGVGRNALVHQYLRQGDLQATVTALGRSQGHLGVELAATHLIDGGELRLDAPARITLPAGQAVVYRFAVAQAGDYRLLAMGLGFVYQCRIEDADGWPIAPPNAKADVSRHFDAGTYRLVLLPQPLTGRAVTRLSRVRQPLRFTAREVRPLPLDRTAEAVWREPEAPSSRPPAGSTATTANNTNAASVASVASAVNAEDTASAASEPARTPDRWRFSIPAASTTTIALDAEMEGTVTRVAGAEAAAATAAQSPAASPASPMGASASGNAQGDAAPAPAEPTRVPPGRSVTVDLPPGTYELAVVCSRHNSLVRYHVRVTTAELVDGQDRLLQAPVRVPVSVAGGGLVEIASYAASDVRARLYAADGTLVADQDDRPDDWNFLISEHLAAGRYQLEIEPVGRSRAQLRVAMRTVAEVEDPPLVLPFHGDVAVGEQVHLLPLPAAGEADLLLAAARSDDNLGLALEVRDGTGWRRVAGDTGHTPRVELALAAGATAAGAGNYRLRLWSLDRRGASIELAAAAVAVPHVGEGRLTKGTTVPLLRGLRPPLGPLAAAVVDMAAPGLARLRLQGGVDGGATGAAAGGATEPGDAAERWRAGSIAGQALAPLASGGGDLLVALAAEKDRLWLVAAAPQGAPRLRGERLPVPAGLGAGVSVRLPAAGVQVEADAARRDGGGSGPLLAMATAPAGQPALVVGESGANADSAAWPAPAAAMGVGAHSAVAVALDPHRPLIRAWNGDQAAVAGDRSPAGQAAGELRLTQISFAAPAAEAGGWGVTGGNLAGLAARRFDLPPGRKVVHLNLGGSLVAVLSTAGSVASTHWQGGQPFAEVLDTSATRLTVLHTREDSDPFTFEVLARHVSGGGGSATAGADSAADGDGDLALASGEPFTRSFDQTGILRLRLAGTAPGDRQPRRYRVFCGTGLPGESGGVQVTLLDGAGGVRQVASRTGVAEIAGAPGGDLLIQHGPGTVVVWDAALLAAATAATAAAPAPAGAAAAANAATAAAPWQAPLAAPAQAVTPPATAPLAGRFAHYTLDLPAAAVLSVRADAPALTLLRRAGDPAAAAGAPAATDDAVAIHPAGVRLDAWLPAGVSHLGFAALGGGVLTGPAEITTTPVVTTGEGLGPEILLPPGDSRYFSFHVATRRPIGWGAAAAADRVSCRLLRGNGQPVSPAPATAAPGAAGAAMLDSAELDAGDYLLVLSAPADAAPVRVRPVVVGLQLPDTGPPPDVIRKYMQDAGAVAAVPSGSHP